MIHDRSNSIITYPISREWPPIAPSGDGIFFYDILHIGFHRDNIYFIIHKLLLVINLPHFGHSLLISPNIGLPQDIEGFHGCS